MYSEEDLTSAVAAGALTQNAVDALRAHVESKRRASAIDDEVFRLVSGFNDIFVVIACLLLLVSVGVLGAVVAPWVSGAAVAACAFGLALFFTRKRHMALPSIVLLMAFVGGLFTAVDTALAGVSAHAVWASAVAAAAALLHWRWFRVPITVAAGVAAVVGFVAALLVSTFPPAAAWTPVILLLAGVAVFALAVHWDARDPLRRSRSSDVAFWLHLLAAPLIVHGVFQLLGLSAGGTSPAQAAVVILLYVAIAAISLAIDRRALMVAALGYVLYTLSELLQSYGVVSLGFAITALAIGSALLILAAFWHASRTAVLRFFPDSMRRWIAPLR